MKKKFTIAAFVFGILTVLCGMIVLFSFGKVDISIAVIPLLFFIACIQWVSAINKKEKSNQQNHNVQ